MSTTALLFNTEYQLDIYEVRPAGNNPNIVVSTTLPVFTTTTNQTFYNLGMVDIPLQVGMQYVWRVRAYDITGRAYFKNNGYSQVCTFTYGNIGEAIAGGITLNLTANGLGPRLAQANWNASSSFTNYTFEMRKKGEGNEWFPYTSTDGSLKLTLKFNNAKSTRTFPKPENNPGMDGKTCVTTTSNWPVVMISPSFKLLNGAAPVSVGGSIVLLQAYVGNAAVINVAVLLYSLS